MRATLVLFSLFVAADLIEVVPPRVPLTKRMLFVVDTSGSMEGHKFSHACQAVLEIASQPIDEMEMALIAFQDGHARWPGVPDPGPAMPPPPLIEGQAPVVTFEAGAPLEAERLPPGWARLPSREAVDAASAWLAQRPPDGGTQVIPALEAALDEPRKELSVVLVTDGQFYQEKDEHILEAVERAQRRREERGLLRAVIVIYGVGETSDLLRQLGLAGQGGFYRRPPAPTLPEPDATPGPPRPKRRSTSTR